MLLFGRPLPAAQGTRTPPAAVVTTTASLAHHEIKPSDLPPPKIEDNVNNAPNVIARPAGAQLTMPPGLKSAPMRKADLPDPAGWLWHRMRDVFVAGLHGKHK